MLTPQQLQNLKVVNSPQGQASNALTPEQAIASFSATPNTASRYEIAMGIKNSDGTPNTKRISAIRWAADHYSGPAAQNVFKSDFIKLREISLGYTLPLRSNVIQDLKISAYGRNLAIWGPDTKHFDPESATTSSGNVQGIEGGALPSVASFGVNVGFKF